MWIGSNGSRPIAAWIVAYPMFVLYPGVAALAASRARSPNVVIALATLVSVAALWLALSPVMVGVSRLGVRDDRLKYALETFVCGLGLLVAIRNGERVMRRGHRLRGFVIAGAIFVVAACIAFTPELVITT